MEARNAQDLHMGESYDWKPQLGQTLLRKIQQNQAFHWKGPIESCRDRMIKKFGTDIYEGMDLSIMLTSQQDDSLILGLG